MITTTVGNWQPPTRYPTFVHTSEVLSIGFYAASWMNPTVSCMLCNEAKGPRDGGADPGDADEGSIDGREERLRSFCCRIYGWDGEQTALVEDAMEALRAAISRCAVIALRGEGDLVPIAHALHRQFFGLERPFVVCDPRRREGDGSVRSPPNRTTSARALDAATGGSICLRSSRLPEDYRLLAPSLRAPTGTQLFVCLYRDDPIIDVLCPPLRIPSLTQRAPDLERLVAEYVADVSRELGVRPLSLSRRMLGAIVWRTETLADLEKVVTRIVVLKSASTVSNAAARLDMAAVSLSRWAARRGILKILEDERGG